MEGLEPFNTAELLRPFELLFALAIPGPGLHASDGTNFNGGSFCFGTFGRVRPRTGADVEVEVVQGGVQEPDILQGFRSAGTVE